MKFLFASDSFKGTLSSERITALLKESAERIFPGCETAGVPVADGGEGTLDAVILALNGKLQKVMVHGPLMEERESFYGEFVENGASSAIIEMAAASGLPMVPAQKRNPLNTTTYGTGELIKAALDRGCRSISIAIGGSATNDGGMGAMKALGVRFLDERGEELEGKGGDLIRVADIDISGIHPAVAETRFTVMCDVNNPLTGPRGATYTFGKQKGGTPEILDVLEKGMVRYAALIKEKLGVDVDGIPGSGAAGGLGAAFCVFLKAGMKSGIDTVLDLIHFDELLDGVDLVITGEGRMDWQSAYGKVPSGIGARCKAKNIPVVAIVGGMGDKAETIFDFGIDSIVTTINGAMPIEEALDRSEELYSSAADRTFRLLRAGMRLR
ncbi:glycerate kinase family protein [Lacrimispora sp. 210928-DFI.3.58]|uniref:glycerate kinase family protein n=1 Tax=Lacrimispora sp. 210928-DFI.3.58 TaxID=2883214 RepID=UPI0015B61239|nr:glycerate kinase [Lacrimispora sp. 210928-DFI.3.58]MCB7321179.1 glycerate kinase [Lacrimispora sp. 210928-DFI.3.58]